MVSLYLGIVILITSSHYLLKLKLPVDFITKMVSLYLGIVIIITSSHYPLKLKLPVELLNFSV